MAAANRYRPRAPSPSQHQPTDFDSDNTYSLVQDSMRDRKMTQVARLDRMFGDSANEDEFSRPDNRRLNVHSSNNKFGSVSSNSTNSSSFNQETRQIRGTETRKTMNLPYTLRTDSTKINRPGHNIRMY